MKKQQTSIIRVFVATGFLLGEVPPEVRAILTMLHDANLIQFKQDTNTFEYTVNTNPTSVIARWKSFGFKAEHVAR